MARLTQTPTCVHAGVGGFHGPVWYGYDARRNGGMVLLIIVIIGLVTAFVGLYRLVRFGELYDRQGDYIG